MAYFNFSEQKSCLPSNQHNQLYINLIDKQSTNYSLFWLRYFHSNRQPYYPKADKMTYERGFDRKA